MLIRTIERSALGFRFGVGLSMLAVLLIEPMSWYVLALTLVLLPFVSADCLFFLFVLMPRLERARLIVRVIKQFEAQRDDYRARLSRLNSGLDAAAIRHHRRQYTFDCCRLAVSSVLDSLHQGTLRRW